MENTTATNKNFMFDNIKYIALYTGDGNICKGNCPRCCGKFLFQKYSKNQHGNIDQIKYILDKFPNIDVMTIFGNPDLMMDPEFCNLAAKEVIKAGHKVRFSTCGMNALEVAKKAFDGLDPNYVQFIVYSVDSIYDCDYQYFKGSKNVSVNNVVNAIDWLVSKNFRPCIQTTLWKDNYRDYDDLYNYFMKRYNGKCEFSVHIGTLQNYDKFPNLTQYFRSKIITPDIIDEVRNIVLSKNIYCPNPFINLKELDSYNKFKLPCCCPETNVCLDMTLLTDDIRVRVCPSFASFHHEREMSLYDYNENTYKQLYGCCKCNAEFKCDLNRETFKNTKWYDDPNYIYGCVYYPELFKKKFCYDI